MNFWRFFKDHLTHIFGFLLGLIFLNLIIWIDSSLKASIFGLLYLDLLSIVFLFLFLIVLYWSRRNFYEELQYRTEHPEKGFEERLNLAQTNTNKAYERAYNALLDYSRLTNNELVEQLANQKEFIDTWIHEIKVPIAALQLLNESIADSIAANKNEKINTEIHKMDHLVEQVLYYSRLENFSNDYLIAKYSIKDIVKDVAIENMNYILNKDITFNITGTDATILTDEKWLKFILNQLLSNAIKYTPEHGKVEFSITTSHSKVILSLRDNGIGIPAADLVRVFEQGFTGENGRKQNTKSTGLGLYLASKMAKKLAHELTIDSVENEGTTVSLTFSHLSYYNDANETNDLKVRA